MILIIVIKNIDKRCAIKLSVALSGRYYCTIILHNVIDTAVKQLEQTVSEAH